MIRAPLPLAALWLVQAIAIHLLETTPSLALFDLDAWTDPRKVIGLPLWLLLSSFLWAAILVRYAHPRTTGMPAFFAGGRAFFGRILRLALLTVVIFAVVDRLGTLGQPPEDDLMAVFRLAYWGPLAASLFVQIFVQLAEVRTIVEDRRSVLFALAAGWRLLAARPVTVLAMCALAGLAWLAGLILVFLGVFVRGLFGLGDGDLDGPGLFVSQFVIASIVLVDLQISASLMALYEAEMTRGHSEYDAAEASSGLTDLRSLTAKE